MREGRRHVVVIASVVLALHCGVLWLLLARSRVSITTGSQSIEIVLISPPRVRSAAEDRTVRSHPKQNVAPSPPFTPSPVPEPPQDDTARAPVDWDAELARAAEDAARGVAGEKPRDFGFPKIETPAKRAEFAWNHAATHRVESIPGGGLLVNLNDNCVLVFVPLPFVFCRPGRKPANGQLFHEMVQPSMTDQDGVSP
jgi:hypothetical protein